MKIDIITRDNASRYYNYPPRVYLNYSLPTRAHSPKGRKKCSLKKLIQEELRKKNILDVKLRFTRSKHQSYYNVVTYYGGNIDTITGRWDAVFTYKMIV